MTEANRLDLCFDHIKVRRKLQIEQSIGRQVKGHQTWWFSYKRKEVGGFWIPRTADGLKGSLRGGEEGVSTEP